MQDSELKKALVSLVMGVLLALGLLVYFFGDRSYFRFGGGGEEKGPSAPCANDPACAAKKAAALEDMSHGELRNLARALGAALGRKDCGLSTELANGVEQIAITEAALAARRRAAVTAQRAACEERKQPAPAPPPVGSKIVLERTRCASGCPAYTVTVHPDGIVEFEGKSGVAVTGQRSYGIERKRAMELFDLLERVGFDEFDAEYLSSEKDLPLARITLVRGNSSHSVVADGPCTTPAAIEAGMCFLPQRIDAIADSARFLPVTDR